MRNTFVQALTQPQVAPRPITARTQNGMRARATTSNPALDLFGSIGASRGKDILPAFKAAFAENQDLALRIAQWARDVRGGAGERQLYRDILLEIEKRQPKLLVESRLLDNLPELGRFDDLLIFTNVEVRAKALSILADALVAGNGLAAKWTPRKGENAIILRNALGMTPKQFRKLLVNNTKVVETQMCAKNWNEINFSHVPSVAMTRYMKAFYRNAPEAFEAYKAALVRNDGTAKVNAGAVYPYQVVQALDRGDETVATAMWDSLRNYMGEGNKSVLPMIDVSASMTWCEISKGVQPYHVASSLGLYCADKAQGAFKDVVLMFTSDAEMMQLRGSLRDKLNQIKRGTVHGSTNLHAAFATVLNHALRNRVPASDMPGMIVIFSDMQFNSCTRHDDSALQMIRRKYEDAGYEMPQIVFWNLNDAGNKPVKFDDSGTALVSGFSPALMESLLAADLTGFTPESVMLKTVGKDRYSW